MKNFFVYALFVISLIFFIISLILRFNIFLLDDMLKTSKLTEITVNNSYIDIGKVSNLKLAQGSFYIKNTGVENLILDKVEVSCSCSSSTFLNEKIAPDDSVKITVSYNKKTGGYFYSDVLVHGNFSGSPKIMSFEGFYSEKLDFDEIVND
jgi:hypothetical protein